MACGDRYRHLAVTASGLNLANAYDGFPSFTDYEEWKELARSLSVTAQRFHDTLGEVEEERTPGNFARWNAVNELRTEMVEKYDALPSSYLNFDPAENISAAQAVVLDALCVIERSEDEIVALGAEAPLLPGAPDPHENDGIGATTSKAITTLVLLGGAALAITMLARKRR
jgi:hypothetical protein